MHGIGVGRSPVLPLPPKLVMIYWLQFPGVSARKWFGFVWLLTWHLFVLFVCFLHSKFTS